MVSRAMTLTTVCIQCRSLERRWQTSGEIKFTGDVPVKQGELHAAFVLSDRANCDLISCNPQDALAIDGVVDFVYADDVPGINGWKPWGETCEEIFSTGKIHYAGQSLGLIIAETREIALEAARNVKVVYSNITNNLNNLKTIN